MPPTITDLRNLPGEVIERLGESLAERVAGFDVTQRGRVLEARHPMRPFEIRQDEDGNPILEGYATIYGVAYDVFGGPPLGWSEMFEAGSCDRTVEDDDIRLLVNHDGIPLGRNTSGTLRLDSDRIGVRCESHLDGTSPLVTATVSAMTRGDLDEMSVAFRALRQEWNEDFTERRILEARLFDVSVVTFPANPATVVQIRGDEPATEEETRSGFHVDLARAIRDRLTAAV